jgi:antitoxin component of MazEF toxin-antitoxin module
MTTKTISLRIADDGTVTIPDDLIRNLRLSPHQTVTVEVSQDAIVLAPSGVQRFEQIGRLLQTALSGAEWSEIEEDRRDRCFLCSVDNIMIG